MSKWNNFDRVLCLSPHPDDVEYSMLGTILKFNGTEFTIICLSQSGDYDVPSADRTAECQNCLKLAGCTNVVFIGGFNHYVKDLDEDEWIYRLENEYQLDSYQALCIPPPNDDTHFEHRLVGHIGRTLGRVLKINIFEYRTPSTVDHWSPNYYVDISEQLETKLNALKEFKSQIHRVYFNEHTLQPPMVAFQC